MLVKQVEPNKYLVNFHGVWVEMTNDKKNKTIRIQTHDSTTRDQVINICRRLVADGTAKSYTVNSDGKYEIAIFY